MPAVRVKATAFSDERFAVLAKEAGLADADCARGKMLRLWRQCAVQRTNYLPAAVVAYVLGPTGCAALETSGLGELIEGMHEYRIAGVSESHEEKR